MKDPFSGIKAFEGFEELLVWQQDKSPHLRGSFRATVLRGEGGSNNAGGSRDPLSADGYTVMVDWRSAVVGQLTIGDTIKRADGTVLTIQQLTREHGIGVTVRCTADERALR